MREAILGMENKVKDLRDKIDEIDLKILDLIQSRAIHASKIGKIKKESPDFNGIFYKPEREKEIIDRLTKKNSEPLRIDNVKNIFKEIISACLSIEGELSLLKKIILGALLHHSQKVQLREFSRVSRWELQILALFLLRTLLKE